MPHRQVYIIDHNDDLTHKRLSQMHLIVCQFIALRHWIKYRIAFKYWHHMTCN